MNIQCHFNKIVTKCTELLFPTHMTCIENPRVRALKSLQAKTFLLKQTADTNRLPKPDADWASSIMQGLSLVYLNFRQTTCKAFIHSLDYYSPLWASTPTSHLALLGAWKAGSSINLLEQAFHSACSPPCALLPLPLISLSLLLSCWRFSLSILFPSILL